MTDPDVLTDGYGSEWYRCLRPDCDLEVVRIGKVQCSDPCWRGLPDWAADEIVRLRQLVAIQSNNGQEARQ